MLDRHLHRADLRAQQHVRAGEAATQSVGAAQVRAAGLAAAGAEPLRDRLDRAPRDQQRDRRGEAVDLELELDRQRRFADRREHAGVSLGVDLAAHQLRAADLVPRDRQPIDDRVEHAPREHPVDLGQMAGGGSLGGLASEQAFDRLQDHRQLDAHQHVPFDRRGLDGHRDRVRRQLRLGGRPRVLADVGQDEVDLGLELTRQPAPERLAEEVDRPHDPAPELGGELGRLGEVERPHRLGGVACELLVDRLRGLVDGLRGLVDVRDDRPPGLVGVRDGALLVVLADAHARLSPRRQAIRPRPRPRARRRRLRGWRPAVRRRRRCRRRRRRAARAPPPGTMLDPTGRRGSR